MITPIGGESIHHYQPSIETIANYSLLPNILRNTTQFSVVTLYLKKLLLIIHYCPPSIETIGRMFSAIKSHRSQDIAGLKRA